MTEQTREEALHQAEMIHRFFGWIKERQSIYEKRKLGEPWPWTQDPILQEYKFTNVYRKQDAVTKDLLRALRRLNDKRPMNILFTICVYRMFNWPETFSNLELHAVANIGEWDEDIAKAALDGMADRGEKIWTGAYMVTGSGSEGRPKHYLACESLTQIFHDAPGLAIAVQRERSLEYATKQFTEYPMISNFVGYELACDLSYTKVLSRPKDKFTWANPGPGAKRGLSRIFFGGRPDTARLNEQQANEYMRKLLKMSSINVPGHFPKLQMRDIEHSLCEFDKYERVRCGEGRPRSRFTPPWKRKK